MRMRKTRRIAGTGWSRRDWLRLGAAGVLGGSMSGWLPALASDAADHPQRRRACILLWMSGGPSQTDTFDLKPEHENGGEFKPIDTSVAGIGVSEHLPQLAQQMKDVAIIRSMNTAEGDHARASYLLRTGHRPQGPIQYPTLGSLLSKEMADDELDLPKFVSVAPYQFLSPAAFGPGFLGPKYAPMVVGGNRSGQLPPQGEEYSRALEVENLSLAQGVDRVQAKNRMELLDVVEQGFAASRPEVPVQSHRLAYESAVRMMNSQAVEAFDLSHEPDELRARYGNNLFGQGCLLARRLVERGVPFVEVSLNGASERQTIGWDTHQNNFPQVQALSGVLDAGWSALMDDLRSRGLLDSTLIVWMGEFGRTPKINNNSGRDHYPAAWSTVLAGGGIKGGQAVGKTSLDGMKVEDRPVSVPDLLATVCGALGIDTWNQNMSNVGRPIRLVDPEAVPIEEILG